MSASVTGGIWRRSEYNFFLLGRPSFGGYVSFREGNHGSPDSSSFDRFFFAPKKNHPPALHAPWYCNTATPPRAAGATCMKSRCLCSCDEQIFLQGKPTKKQGKSPNKQCKPNKNEDFRYIPLPKSDDFVAPRPLKKRSRWQHQVIQEKWHAQALYQSYFRASATSILTLRCYI